MTPGERALLLALAEAVAAMLTGGGGLADDEEWRRVTERLREAAALTEAPQ